MRETFERSDDGNNLKIPETSPTFGLSLLCLSLLLGNIYIGAR